MIDYQPEDYSNYRLQRAKDTILEVETHIKNFHRKSRRIGK